MKKIYKSLFATAALLLMAGNVSAAPNPAFKSEDYVKALWMTGRFYGAQRSGDSHNWLIAKHQVGSYNGTSFVKDADGSYDLTGGWFDCGDHVKFGQTEFYSAYMLALGYSEFPEGYDDFYSQDYNGYISADNYTWEGKKGKPNGIPDILDELKHATDYFMKTIRDKSTFYYQVGDGNADHQQWVTSVKMSTLENGQGGEASGSRKVAKGSGNVTDMVALCGATLAIMSRVYKPYDSEYAAKCLEKAKLCVEFVNSNAQGSIGCDFYGAKNTVFPDLVVLNMEMYRATNDKSYISAAETAASKFMDSDKWNHNWSICYAQSHDLAYYLLAAYSGGKYVTKANEYLEKFATMYKGNRSDKLLFAKYDAWGALRYPANQAFLFALMSKMKGETEINEYTLRTIEYIMGSNSRKFSYIVGFGDNSPIFPHHRNYFGDDNNNMKGLSKDKYGSNSYKYRQFGFLAGGSVNDGAYNESLDSYQYSEGGIDYNAGLVSALGYIVSKLSPVNNGKFGHPTPELGNTQSICGRSSIELDSKIASDGKKNFTWTCNGVEVAKGTDKNKYTATKAGVYVCKVDSAREWDSEGRVEITGVLPEPNLGGDVELCNPAQVTLDAQVESDVVKYSWKKDKQEIAGANASKYTVTSAGKYKCIVSAEGCESKSASVEVTSKLPVVPDATNGAGGKVTLTVESNSDDYEWYDKAEGGTLLGKGKSLELTITENKTVYVQDAGSATFVAGPKSFKGTGVNWGDISANFTALKPFIITGFTIDVCNVYNKGTQTVTVELAGAAKTSVTTSADIQATGKVKITLDTPLEIKKTGDYSMTVKLQSGAIAYYESGDAYSSYQGDANVIKFTSAGQNNATNGAFPGITDWQIQSGSGCERAVAHAIYDPKLATCNDVTSASLCSVYPNPARDVLNINVPEEDEIQAIEIETLEGSIVKSVKNASVINVSNLAQAMYIVKVTTSNGQYIAKFVKE